MTDREIADGIYKAVAGLNDMIYDAAKAGIVVRLDALTVSTHETPNYDLLHADIARPFPDDATARLAAKSSFRSIFTS